MLTPGTKSKSIDNRIKSKTINFVYLNIPYEQIDLKQIRGEKQKKVIKNMLTGVKNIKKNIVN